MGGLGVLFVIGLYFFIASAIVGMAKPIWLKVVMLLVVLLVPTADAIYGRMKLKQMCAEEAGLKVNRVVEHVAGFLDETGTKGEWVQRDNYKFVEDRLLDGMKTTTRFTEGGDGKVLLERNVAPKSQYRLRTNDFGEKDTYGHNQFLIEDMATGEILATDTQLTYHGGWAERLLAMFSDSGPGSVAWCPNRQYPEVRLGNLVKSTLKH